MREIKFRAWNNEQAKTRKDFRFDEFNDVNDYFADNDFVFMQYTGLKDKNGEEIYEGDIVSFSGIKDDKGVVEWCNEYVGYILNAKNNYAERFDEVDKLKVLGNIYENKGLIE